jgi:hypothetical protein
MNVYKDKRFLIDTAGATLLRETLAYGEARDLHIRGLRWVGATTAGHTVVIQDSDSIVLWASVASGANYVEESDCPQTWQKDFKVVTLASGILYVYLATAGM